MLLPRLFKGGEEPHKSQDGFPQQWIDVHNALEPYEFNTLEDIGDPEIVFFSPQDIERFSEGLNIKVSESAWHDIVELES
jgi:hypothetical protein